MNIIEQIMNDTGISKYRIAKELNVSWQTVNLWRKEVWKPTEKNLKKLEDMRLKFIGKK